MSLAEACLRTSHCLEITSSHDVRIIELWKIHTLKSKRLEITSSHDVRIIDIVLNINGRL